MYVSFRQEWLSNDKPVNFAGAGQINQAGVRFDTPLLDLVTNKGPLRNK
jgi:hypothetical protein